MVDKGKVLMGKEYAYKMIGTGTIRLKMHNGMLRTLVDFLYIFDLKNNLISLENLDFNRYNAILEGKNLKVLLGAMIVKQEQNEGNLDFLKGYTVIGFVLVITKKTNITRLWHIRLGHVGEKAIMV